MISIEEKTSKKLSGLTSLFVSFEYNPKYVQLLKTTTPYSYDANTHTWEVPLTSLRKLLTELSKYDTIQLNLKDYSKEPITTYKLKNYKTKPYNYQIEGIQYGLNHKQWLLLDAPGLGKAFTLDTPVLTTAGFIPINNVHIGDKVFDENGKTCNVVGTFLNDNLNMYNVVFEDDTCVNCCEDHLWQVLVSDQIHTLSTKQILNRLNIEDVFIPVCNEVDFGTGENLDSPVRLGDQLFNLYCNMIDKDQYNHCSQPDIEGLIPDVYKYGSIECRKQLLKSILHISDICEAGYFQTVSLTLFDDITFLVESLGGIVTERKLVNDIHSGTIKFDLYKQVKSITYIGKQTGKCLTVDSPSSLYLVKDFIVTHNTLQITYLAEEIKKRDKISHCLVICGVNTLKANWKREIQKHSFLNCMILGERQTRSGNTVIGTIPERVEQLKHPIKEFFIITNIETLRNDDIIKALKSGKNKIDMIILDEAHVIKDPSSKQSKNLQKLTAEFKVALTGTFLLNSPLDSYVPLKWIGVEKSNFSTFKSFYCTFGGFFGSEVLGYKNIPVLQQLLDSCSLRRTKDILNLPEKTVIEEIVEMNSPQQVFYDNIKKGIIDEVDKVHISTVNLLAMVTRLRQATALPSMLTSENIESSKVLRACDIVEQLISNNEKVVIFSTFKDTCYDLAKRLRMYQPVVCTGDTSAADIDKNIETFQHNPNVKVMIATHQKMGTGITLTAASNAIFIDLPWTDGNFCQACDRIHRIGTHKPVTIYCLTTANTIDERVMEIVKDKSAISGYVLDNEITEQGLESLKKYIAELK